MLPREFVFKVIRLQVVTGIGKCKTAYNAWHKAADIQGNSTHKLALVWWAKNLLTECRLLMYYLTRKVRNNIL